MSDTYLDLYKLQLGEQPFTVDRVVDSELQNSPQCQLPGDHGLLLNLPPIDIELPPLECRFDNLVPLIPLPETCHPKFLGGINFSTCDPQTLDVTGTVDIIQDGCNFLLGGDIELCSHYCTSYSVSNSVAFTVDGPGLTMASNGLDFSINPLTCNIELSGGFQLTSDIKCALGITASGQITPSSDSEYLSVAGGITLNKDGDCGVKLDGSLTFDLDVACPEGYQFNWTMSQSGQTNNYTIAGSASMDLELTYSVTADTGGDNCVKGWTLSITPSVTFNGIGVTGITLCDGEGGGSSTINVLTVD